MIVNIYNGSVRRKLGQYFLRSRSVLQKVVTALPVSSDVVVLEVGPGKGALTACILERYSSVVAVEKDSVLVGALHERFADVISRGALTVVDGDVRDGAWLEVVGERPYVVIANIPYYLTGSLIKDLLTSSHPPVGLSLVVQKEVAERIVRRDGKESLLSLSVQLFGTVRYVVTVPRRSFSPQPSVDSAVIAITDVHTVSGDIQDAFFSVVKTGFQGKRKCVLKKFDADLQRLFRQHGVTPTDRAEDVPFAVWLAVVREYVGCN